MIQRILGLICVLWGGAIFVSSFVSGGPEGAGAYAAGQYGAIAFGVLLFVVGMFALIRSKGPTKE